MSSISQNWNTIESAKGPIRIEGNSRPIPVEIIKIVRTKFPTISLDELKEETVVQLKGSTTIKVSQLVLRHMSDFFSVDISRFEEGKNHAWQLPTIEYITFYHLLDYAYTGKVEPITRSEVSDLIEAADFLQMDKLREQCIPRLVQHLTDADKFGAPDLSCRNWIYHWHFDDDLRIQEVTTALLKKWLHPALIEQHRHDYQFVVSEYRWFQKHQPESIPQIVDCVAKETFDRIYHNQSLESLISTLVKAGFDQCHPTKETNGEIFKEFFCRWFSPQGLGRFTPENPKDFRFVLSGYEWVMGNLQESSNELTRFVSKALFLAMYWNKREQFQLIMKKGIEVFDFSNLPVGNAELEQLKGYKIKKLTLSGSEVSSKGLKYLDSSLQDLDLQRCTHISKFALRNIPSHIRVKEPLDYPKTDDRIPQYPEATLEERLIFYGRCPKNEELLLELNDELRTTLREKLVLSGACLTEKALKPLKGALVKWLITRCLSDHRIAKTIINMPELVELDIRFCKDVTDEGILALQKAPKLQILHLNGHLKITDAALDHLSKMPQLKTLYLRECHQFSAEAIHKIMQTSPLASSGLQVVSS